MTDEFATPLRKSDGWAIAFAMLFPSLLTYVYFVLLAENAAIFQQVSYGFGKAIQFAFPIVWWLGAQSRRLEFSRPRGAGVPSGVAFGLLVVATMWGLYHGVLKPAGVFEAVGPEVRDKLSGFRLNSPVKYFALGTFYSLVHSLMEEYYWRWFVFAQLRRILPPWTAIWVSSAGFMAHHVIVLAIYFGWSSPWTLLFSLAVGVGGLVWGWLYHRHGSLYAPWLSHLLVDAGIYIVGYDLVRDLMGG